MKNILITGAGGFLGNELIEQLSKTTHRIFALTSKKEKIKEKFPNQCNVFSIQEWKDGKLPLNTINTVIHCAFSTASDFIRLKESLDFSKEIFSNSNYNVINVSTKSVYGHNPQTPWTENSEVMPINTYAFAKYSAEIMLDLKHTSKTSSYYTNIRLAGLIGSELNDRVVNKFIDFAIVNNTINIKGGGQQFAYLDVRDAAAGIIALLAVKAESWKSTYNLGHTKSFNIIEIANIVKRIATEFIYKEVIVNIVKTDEILYAELDSSSFYKDTKWEPKYNMEDIVRKIFENKIFKNQESDLNRF